MAVGIDAAGDQLVLGQDILSTHNGVKEAYERASQRPDGVYDIVTANERR